jgi:hypothetical protein
VLPGAKQSRSGVYLARVLRFSRILAKEGNVRAIREQLSELWRAYNATPYPFRYWIRAGVAVVFLMTIRYWQIMLPWIGVVILVAGSLLLSRRRGRSQL